MNFWEEVKMVLEDEDLEAMGIYAEEGMIDTIMLKQLIVFCDGNPQYHIVTQVDCNGEIRYCNRIVWVNRVGYYLAKGSKDGNLEAIAD